MGTRRAQAALLAAFALGAAPPVPALAPRTFLMGFSSFPPRPEVALALRSIDTWSTRADAALMVIDLPWEKLLAGADAEALVRGDPLNLARYYRAKGLRIVATLDLTNGVDRKAEAAPLARLQRSLAEPAVRAAAVRYAAAFASIVRPEWLGLASETNLVRAVAPPGLYAALVQAAREEADAVRRARPEVKPFTTVQVEVAWGRLVPGPGFAGIARDRADFPFAAAIGLSSYPYLGGFARPEDLPDDYYARLVDAKAPLPVMVIEGGWTSAGVGAMASSPDVQRRYIERQARLLDAARALAVFQIDFTDLDLAAFPPLPPHSILPLFAHLGLVDAGFTPKPALAAWDAVFRRPLRPSQ